MSSQQTSGHEEDGCARKAFKNPLVRTHLYCHHVEAIDVCLTYSTGMTSHSIELSLVQTRRNRRIQLTRVQVDTEYVPTRTL